MEQSPSGHVDTISRTGSTFCSFWKCWVITALSLATLFLLFQPWLVASGPFGDARSDAFGRLEGSIPTLRTVGHHPAEGLVSLSGLWGALIGLAAIVTLVGVQLYRNTGFGLLMVIGGNTANAVFVSGALLYLDAKAPEFREMTAERDELKAVLGEFVNSLVGGTVPDSTAAQQATTAGLTGQALICGLLAVVSAVVAVTIRKRVTVAVGEAGAMQNLMPGAVHEAAYPGGERPCTGGEIESQVLEGADPVSDDELCRVRAVDRQNLLPGAERPRRRGNQPPRTRSETRPARRSRPRQTPRALTATQR